MRRIALLAVLAFALPVSASAQTHLIVGAGLSRPISDFGDAVDSGMHGRVGLQVGIPVFPVSLRGEAELQSYSEAVGDDKTNVLSGSLSAVLSLGGIGLRPYLIAGLGNYGIKGSGADGRDWERGLHGGFGASLGALGFGGFAEVRFVNVDGTAGDTRFVTATLGLRF